MPNVSVVAVEFDGGTGTPGCAQGATAISSHLRRVFRTTPSKICHTVQDSMASRYTPKNWTSVRHACFETEVVCAQALSRARAPFMIGGDHGLAYGSISAVSKFAGVKALKVFWFDAHADINSVVSSPTKNFHGMPVRFLIDSGKLLPENIVYFGLRSVDDGEAAFIASHGIKVYTADQVKNPHVLRELVSKELSKLNYSDHLHLSFDLDFFDGDCVPGVGTPERNGPTFVDYSFLEDMKGYLKSADLVEFAPRFDPYGVSQKVAFSLAEKIYMVLKNV
jgi:arginase